MSLAFVRSASAFIRVDAIYANGQEISKLKKIVGCVMVDMGLRTSFYLNFFDILISIWKDNQKYLLTHLHIVGTLR